jgi:uncharacterized protein (TIGR02145 family)
MKKFGIIFFAFILFASCQKKDTNDNPNNNSSTENLLSSNSYIVDTSAVQGVTDNSITLLKSNTSLKPKTGDILIANPTLNNPFGFLRKVISVTENVSEIVCNTEQSNLNDAFAQLSFKTNYLDTFSSNQSFRTGAKFGVKFTDNLTIANGIKLNGEFFFNIPSVQIEYKRIKGSLAPEKILIQADFNTDGSTLEITNSSNTAIQVGPKIITDAELPLKIFIPIPVPTPVGIIIVRVPFVQKLVIKTLPINISGKAKWTTFPKISATLGAKYENSQWTNLSKLQIDASAMPLAKGDFAPSLSFNANVVFFTPEYSIAPYKVDFLKTFFSIPNTLDFTVQSGTPNYLLKYKTDVVGGIREEFFTAVKREFTITGNVITKTILEGNFSNTAPVLTTGSITSITSTSANSGGDIINNGGTPITARGVCWSTAQNPTISNSRTSDGAGNGSFISSITGLSNNTTYYVRAYATNSTETVYGNQVSFTTLQAGTSPSVTIGNQVWMSADLGVTNYRNGDVIPQITNDTLWINATYGAWCYFKNNPNNGKIYNYYAVIDTRGLAPLGWHIPSWTEVTTLANNLGGFSVAGGKLKTTTGWLSPNVGATNSSGFNGYSGGSRVGIYLNGWDDPFVYARYWTAPPFGDFVLVYNRADIGRTGGSSYKAGKTVRCIKD